MPARTALVELSWGAVHRSTPLFWPGGRAPGMAANRHPGPAVPAAPLRKALASATRAHASHSSLLLCERVLQPGIQLFHPGGPSQPGTRLRQALSWSSLPQIPIEFSSTLRWSVVPLSSASRNQIPHQAGMAWTKLLAARLPGKSECQIRSKSLSCLGRRMFCLREFHFRKE